MAGNGPVESEYRLAAEVAAAMAGTDVFSDRLQRCATLLVDRLDAAFARIWMLNRVSGILELQASAGMYTHLDGPHSRVPVGRFKVGLIASEGRPHLTNSVIGDPRVDQEWAEREGMVAFAGYPLIVGGHGVGVMALFARHPLSMETLALLSSVADQLAVGLHHEQQRREVEAATRRLEALHLLGEALAEMRSVPQVASLSLEHAVSATGAAAACVATAESGGELAVLHRVGFEPDDAARFARLPFDGPLPFVEAARTGTALWFANPGEIVDACPDLVEARPHMRAAAMIPLKGDDVPGAMGICFDAPQAFDAAQRNFLLAIARLCSQALARSRLYERERRIAVTLQRSLLPVRLPDIPGLAVAGRYQAGRAGTMVGGDMYDVFLLPGSRVGLAMADIAGDGIPAAVSMGRLRTAVRAFAFEEAEPDQVLERMNRFFEEFAISDFATLIYAIFDTGSRRLSLANAGHPPPLLLDPSGRANYLEVGLSPPLGVPGAHRCVEGVTLDAGSTVVFYTDGLIERRGASIDDGLTTLRTVALAAPDGVEKLCDTLIDTLCADPATCTDDVAVLAISTKLGPSPA